MKALVRREAIGPSRRKALVVGPGSGHTIVAPWLRKDAAAAAEARRTGAHIVARPLTQRDDLIAHIGWAELDDRGEVVLLPGYRNKYGTGVYFGEEHFSDSFPDGTWNEYQGKAKFVISRSQAAAAGATIRQVGVSVAWRSVSAIRLHVIEKRIGRYYDVFVCVVVETLGEVESGMARVHVFDSGSDLTSRALRMHTEMTRPSSPQGPMAQRVGAVARTITGVIAFCKRMCGDSSWAKWAWLSRFLSGVGGSVKIPSHIAKDWNTGVVKPLGDGRFFIRPSSGTALFWMVGGMTVTIRDGRVFGVDVYDFHPQRGQHTLIKGGVWSWAWSGGPDDPTWVPAFGLYGIITLLLPWARYRYIRKEDGHILFSNDLWNALGGRPFQSILEVEGVESKEE